MDVRDSTVRLERVSISASSYGGSGIPGAGIGLTISGSSTVTIANSQLSGGPGGSSYAPGTALSVASPAVVTLSSTTTTGGVTGPVTIAPLATAEWTAAGLAVGNTVTAQFHDTASTPMVILLSWDFARFSTPLAAEPLFVLGTPNWYALAGGVTNAQGDFSLSVTVPNAAGLQYQSVWFTGLFVGALPARSTAPLGGVIL